MARIPDRRTRPDGRPRVVVVAQGPPARGGISSYAVSIVEDSGLARRFDLELLNTTRRAERRAGILSVGNVVHAFVDAGRVLRAARVAAVVHVQTALMPRLPLLRALLLCAAARLGGAGVICHVHSGRVNSGRAEAFDPSPLTRRLLRLLRVADTVLTVSDAGTATLRGLVSGPLVRTADNAVDVEVFAPTRPDRVPPTFLYVGTLSHRKGLADLMRALELRRGGSAASLQLQIVGGAAEVGDEEAEEIRGAVRRAGFGDSLLGPRGPEEVRDRLGRADVFVLPSHWEGQPIAILEAMACGLPVLATRVGAVPDVVRDGEEGLLVEPHDVDGLAAAVDRLASDPALRVRLGAAARARAAAHYDLANLRETVTAAYEDTIGRRFDAAARDL